TGQPPARARQPIGPAPAPVRAERTAPGPDDQRSPRNLRADPRPPAGGQDPASPGRDRNNAPRREGDRPPPPPPPGIRGFRDPTASQVDAPKDASPAPRPKIADRVGQSTVSDQVAPVAQRVVLYDEDPAEPKGKQYVGTVVWRSEPVKGAGSKPGDLAVRADID